MSLQPFYDKRPHRLLWADSRAAHGKIISGTLTYLNELNECEILFSIYSLYAVLGRIKKSVRPIVREKKKYTYYTESRGRGVSYKRKKERKK
jgi:hypothetical protein